ncbi:MAG: cobalamin biosynthesis protein [Lachnospiraceae bacterium]|nr:cobalamin biosynthesis protein [Lachnospiraceae bacterium]
MKLCIISFTENGKQLSIRILRKFEQAEIVNGIGIENVLKIELFSKHKSFESENSVHSVPFVESPLGEWAKVQMCEKNALLFIGACGIAVRAVAPHLADKLHDSPVLVMDEKCRYVIPILSGHMGGANELAVCLAEKMGAEPVITTATDLNGKFAVDLFAKRNGLAIINKEGIAKVSAKILAGEEIRLCMECAEDVMNDADAVKYTEPARPTSQIIMTDVSEKLCLPPEVHIVPYPPDQPVDILITSVEKINERTVENTVQKTNEKAYDTVLLLRPKRYVIGLGCKRGKTAEEIGRLVTKQLDKLGIAKAQLVALASISQKQDEQGVIEWCRRADIPFLTYTAEELQAVEGDFQKSEFVMQTVGVDNVCERAALKACGAGGQLISPKYGESGITIAIARIKRYSRQNGGVV